MKKTYIGLSFIIMMMSSFHLLAQDPAVFKKGELSAANVHHSGNIWLKELVKPDQIFNFAIATAFFDSNAILDWHEHPGGQILFITAGKGYYQEFGKPVQIVQKGDVISCQPNVKHWHGASPYQTLEYLAINANADKGKTNWFNKVNRNEILVKDEKKLVSEENELIQLSKEKWLWMADKNVDTLNKLFDEKAKFIHMGGTMSKEHELNIIKSGGIHYKHAEIQETSVQIIDNTAILLNKIKLTAIVGGNEVINPFTVTEVYIKRDGTWVLGSMSFTKLLTN